MTHTVSSSLERRLERSATIGAALALVIAIAALASWLFDVPRLRQVTDAFPSINPLTAFLLAAAAVALMFDAIRPGTARRRWTVAILAFVVLEAALLRLQELATGWNAGLDHAIFPAAMVRTTLRMAPPTALAFLFHGFALLTMDRGNARGWWLSQLASSLAFAIAVLALSAHAFGASGKGIELFRLMAPQAALAHGLLALGTLAARPRGGLMSVALDDSLAGRRFRRALPVALSVPFLLGWLSVLGVRAGYYGPEEGAAMSVGANTLLLALALWIGTRALIRSEHERRSTELELEDHRRRDDLVVDPARETAEHEAAELRDRERETEQGEAFLSHVSHELSTPLAGVIESVNRLRDGLAGRVAPEQAEHLEIASRNASSLRTMIDDLLDATRAQSGKLTVACRRVALRPLVADTLGSLQGRAARKGVSLTLDPIFTAQDVEADPLRVVQILVNLVDNAIQFTPEGGSIRVSVGVSGGPPPLVVLSVADTGCGIAPEHRDRVFDRFHPALGTPGTGRRGLGLGLSICRQLAKLMGGRLWLESQLGAGSTFHVDLPVWSRRPALARMAPRCVPGEPLALVSVDLATSDGRPLGADREGALLEAHRITDSCVLPDKDVLLPREGPADGRERFHLLARTHAPGAEVLRARVDGELEACAALREAGIHHLVTVTSLPNYQQVLGMDPEDFLEGLITSRLAEDLLKEDRKERAA